MIDMEETLQILQENLGQALLDTAYMVIVCSHPIMR